MSRTRANVLLLLAALLWGIGNVPQKTVLDHLDPVTVVGLCCLIAGVIVTPMAAFERRTARVPGWWASVLKVTVLFALGMAIQESAYLTTTATNAGFLVNTATVMTPFAAWLRLRERPTLAIGAAAAMTLAGSLLLAGGIPGIASSGDLASVLAAICYAVWMVELGRHVQTFGRPIATAAAQFLGTAAIALPLGFALGGPTLQGMVDAAPELFFIGVFSTAVAFVLQTVSQRFTTASHAAVIVSGDALFGAAAATMLLGERLAPLAMTGAGIVLGAIVLAAVRSAENHVTEAARL